MLSLKNTLRNSMDEHDCLQCRYLDEYFGDCCHPRGGGCKDLSILKYCNKENGYALWEPCSKYDLSREEVSQILLRLIR